MALEFEKPSPGKGGGWEMRTRVITVNARFGCDENTISVLYQGFFRWRERKSVRYQRQLEFWWGP